MTTRELARVAAWPMPLSALAGLVRRQLVGLCYHAVCERQPPHLRHLLSNTTPILFERDLKTILRHYTPVGYSDVVSGRATQSRPAPRDHRDLRRRTSGVLYRGSTTPFEVQGFPAVFFVPPGFLDNPRLYSTDTFCPCVSRRIVGGSRTDSVEHLYRRNLGRWLDVTLTTVDDVVTAPRWSRAKR